MTNVLKLTRAILTQTPSGVDQLTLYLPGVGTGIADRWIGGSTGAGITDNIRRAYEFLAHNFVYGQDEIYLFGFSRGAYTARSLSGFIDHVGILLKDQMHLFPGAFNEYRKPPDERDWSSVGHGELEGAGKRLGFEEHSLPLLFVGVWDTVGALGIPLPLADRVTEPLVEFHETGLAYCVRYGYQALAAHELRSDFAPDVWTEDPQSWQTVEQTWFPGAHSDVGGGGSSAGLSDFALQWMANRASSIGLQLDGQYLTTICRPLLSTPVSVSYRGVYRIRGATVRDIGRNGTECKDASVDARLSAPYSLYPNKEHRKLLPLFRTADAAASALVSC